MVIGLKMSSMRKVLLWCMCVKLENERSPILKQIGIGLLFSIKYGAALIVVRL